MINLLKGLRKCHFSKIGTRQCKNITRCVHSYNFDTKEEIVENYIGNVMTIGINLPDSKNVLTDTAVEKLCESFKHFENADEISVAILHGLGGNLCTGLESTDKALEKGRNLMETLNRLSKPVIGSLSGYTTNFGFHLAIMCDILVMEENAMAGFNDRHEGPELLDFMLRRLVACVGLSRAMELISISGLWTSKKCFDSNLVNRLVSCGCSFGQALSWSQSIANAPLVNIKNEKSKVLSALNSLSVKMQ